MKNLGIYKILSIVCFVAGLIFFVMMQNANIGYTVQYGYQFTTFTLAGLLILILEKASK